MTTSLSARLSLEDIARDAFRRAFFLDAFPDERDSLERSFAFLERVRTYKQLLGRRDALQSVAEAIADEFVRDASARVFLASPALSALVARVLEAVDTQRSTPNVFCGLETHVNDRLEHETYAAFVKLPQYAQLCDAVRKHRELPLGEILVDARRTRFLEAFVRETNAAAVGNVLLWVEVQTVFLPLIQTTVVSVPLFEEIQATVRRLYNDFLTDRAPTLATIVPEALRKDILKRILQLQGEPFSPARYATLFRAAHEKIWHWMQTMVYPKFHASALYVALVVETENLESDRQLRKLSEHVQGTPAKASAMVILVEAKSPASRDARFVRVVAPQPSDDAAPRVWAKTLRLPLSDIHVVRVVEVAEADADGRVAFEYVLNGTSRDDTDDDIGCMDYVWNWRHAITLPAVVSPSQRAHHPTETPSPSFHCFSLPTTTNSALYGYVVTTWTHKTASTEETFVSQLLPRFAFVLATRPMTHSHVASGLQRLIDMPLDDVDADQLRDLFAIPKRDAAPKRLAPVFSSFYLQSALHDATFPAHWIFRELSPQTVLTLLATLLVGKSLVVVSPRVSALGLVVNALLELLRPLESRHFVLPLCPVRTACALADRGFFSSPSTLSFADGLTSSPFLLGLQGELVHLKSKESAHEPRHRIRNSIYSVQRVNLQIRRPSLPHAHAVSCQHPDACQYPTDILHTHAMVLDIDADDLYVPDRVDVPEFPQTLVRSLETTIKDAMLGGGLATEDSRLFCPRPSAPAFVGRMLVRDATSNELVAPVDSVRLAVLAFLEALVGDVALYFCSFRQSFAPTDTTTDTTILFEVDAFLDAKIELGCREFFRQVFQTEMFRHFVVRQHRRFASL